jgi:CHAT domain-containing protein
MATRSKKAKPDWVAQLSLQADEGTRRRIFSSHSRGRTEPLVDRLYDEVVKLARVDMERADRVAQASEWLAEKAGDPYARAQSLRGRGHVLYIRNGDHKQAVENYQAALKLFEQLGREREVARTISNAIQPMIYLGQYERTFALTERAREIFIRIGDRLRVARLETNAGNIYYRQDRFSEALDLYRSAYDYFLKHGEVQDVAVTLRNMAVCYISLNRFDMALQIYREARDYCDKNGLPVLVAEADYNVAYLHYLRGEYTRAIGMYDATRALCKKLGDRYHSALCDLDQSELYLELNLSEEGIDLARRAYNGFRELSMGYEAAKALTFQGIGFSQQGKRESALLIFDRARELFRKEINELWPSLIDICKALVLIDMGRDTEARRLCESALAYFRTSPLYGKTALCELLLARLDLQARLPQAAEEHTHSAFAWLKKAEAPAVNFQAYAMNGQVLEDMGNRDAAYNAYLNAHRELEGLRSHLLGEEFKIAFLKDKLSVYESLVVLALAKDRGKEGREAAFDFIERAKSRSLADLIGFGVYALRPKSDRNRKLAARVHELRERLTFAYRQAQREEMRADQADTERVLQLRQQSRQYENQFADAFATLDAADRDLASLINAGTVSIEQIRQTIPHDALLLEYYQARGVLYACVLGGDRLDVVPLASSAYVRSVFRLLQFQLSKFRLGPDYVSRFANNLQEATKTHLRELYRCLIGPVRDKLDAAHLIVVPHGFLHYLPFHALADGDRALLEDFSISYAPSAGVYSLCMARHGEQQRQSLVLGIPDRLAPHIKDEAKAVAAALPGAKLFLGETATQELLWEHAPRSRFVHIATHGLFRQDNPMFSSIRLGKSDLSLFDLYQLRLSAELVTLSGCGTGLNVVVGGDELLGLVRGLLYAGARAVLVTLWDVSDESTAAFMKSFYGQMLKAPNKAEAVRQAMLEVRRNRLHAYHWAPFVLIGNYGTSSKTMETQ